MKKTWEFVHWRTGTGALTSPSREIVQHHNMCSTSHLMKVTSAIRCHEQKNESGGTVQEADFAVDLTVSKFTFDEMFCNFGCHAFVPISWARKWQTAVSHSSAESEVVSLDACFRVEGLLAWTLWDILVDLSEPSVSRASCQLKSTTSQTTQEPLITFHQTLRSPLVVFFRTIKLWQR